MKALHKPELFERSTKVLVRAYIKGQLKHMSCQCCAVGNLIANAFGVEDASNIHEWDAACLKRPVHSLPGEWTKVFNTAVKLNRNRYFELEKGKLVRGVVPEGMQMHFQLDEYKEGARDQIDSTGYPLAILMAIEEAFEMVHMKYRDRPLPTSDTLQFEGLSAVYDVLIKYHKVEAPEKPESVFCADS